MCFEHIDCKDKQSNAEREEASESTTITIKFENSAVPFLRSRLASYLHSSSIQAGRCLTDAEFRRYVRDIENMRLLIEIDRSFFRFRERDAA